MSGENPEGDGAGEDNPPPEVGNTDFNFYAKFAKPLILTLSSTEDRILAASWFSKIKDPGSGPEQLRLDYLKLLLFVLQRRHLAGPFTSDPNAEEQLEEFGEEYELAALARQIIEKEQVERKENFRKKLRGEVGDWPPYSTDFSADLKEYVVAQDIPNFGVHVYYAISKDPVLDWDNSDLANIPRGVKRMEPQGHISETSFAILEPKPVTPEESERCKIMEETGVMPDESIFLGSRRARERRSPFRDIERPAPPLGVIPGEDEENLAEQELPPPTWGSNLIEVREPIDMEGPGTPPPEEVPQDRSKVEHSPEDQEILDLLEKSFNMEDILAEVDAMETEEPDKPDDEEMDPMVLEEQMKFREIEAELDRHDAAIAEALADLDEDEKRMLMEMEAQEAAGLAPKPKSPPKKEVKLVADDDTVMKVLVESPDAVEETREEKKRKAKAAEEKKKKPPGRTGLKKGKGALLKPGEKKEIEEQEKSAKVVETKTGIPSKKSGIPRGKPSKVKISTAVSEGDIPAERPPVSGKGKAIPGKGIPRKCGVPQKVAKPGEPTAEMKEMTDRLDQKLDETKMAFPENFQTEDMAGPSGMQAAMADQGTRPKTPVEELTKYLSKGSPESDDIYDEMDREYQILERLYELYEQLSPDQADALRTPPMFSKHREIRELGRQLRYRPDEFQLHPREQFQPADEYFRGAGAPSPFMDPRDAARMGLTAAAPDTSQAQHSRFSESPPWDDVEELKKIVKMAEKSMKASPAITGGIGTTTPKSPTTPRRPVKKDLLNLFDVESPPALASPEYMATPEFLNDPAFFMPQALTQAKLDEMFAGRQAESEAYIQAEMEAERALWQPKPRTPPPPPPPPMPPSPAGAPCAPGAPCGEGTPQRPSPRPQTPPPSVGGPGTMPVTPGTPMGLPPFQYQTPPHLKMPERHFHIPEPEFEEVDALAIKEIRFQQMPDLVESELDEYDSPAGSPQFAGLHEWYDPLESALAAQQHDDYMLFDTSGEPDLVPAEEDYAQYSPHITLQDRLAAHQIPEEFHDPWRPAATQQLRIGHRKMQLDRRSQPSHLARQVIKEDMTGEEMQICRDMYDEIIKEEEQEFLNKTLEDPDRTEYLKKMAEEAAQTPMIAEEEEMDLVPFEDSISPQPSPERPYSGPPTPKIVRPAYGAVDEELIFQGVPEDQFQGILGDDMPEYLASPGMPSPMQPTPPPPSPPWAPPFEAFMVDDIFAQQAEDIYLASPGMPPGRTVEDELRELGIMSPLRTPPRPSPSPGRRTPSPARQVPVSVPMGSPRGPIGPADIRVSPMRRTPISSPEFDPEAFRREMQRHRVDFAQKEQFQAGQRMLQRRGAMARQHFPIREYAGFEESQRMHTEAEDYRGLMSRLPALPPQAPAAYPEDLMGYEHEGEFDMSHSLLDQPVSPGLPSPMSPKRTLFGWQTPPHLRPIPSDRQMPSRSPTPPPRSPDVRMRMMRAGIMPMPQPQPGEDLFGIRPEDVIPEELLPSPGSPMVPAALMMAEPPPSLPLPTMSMEEQRAQAQQRAQWQAKRLAESSPPRPSPRRQPSPGRPSPKPIPPCAMPPEPSPKVIRRVQDTIYSSGRYDPQDPEGSKRYTKGTTTVEINRPPEGEEGRPPPAPSPPTCTPPAERRRRAPPRVPRAAMGGATPRAQAPGGRMGSRMADRATMPRRRLFADQSGAASRPCPAEPRGDRIQIVEEFEETEHDFIPEHLRGYKWMEDPDADEFYREFKQQFRR